MGAGEVRVEMRAWSLDDFVNGDAGESKSSVVFRILVAASHNICVDLLQVLRQNIGVYENLRHQRLNARVEGWRRSS